MTIHLLDFEGNNPDGTPHHLPSPCGIAPATLIADDNWSDDLASITCPTCRKVYRAQIEQGAAADAAAWRQEIRMQERMGGVLD